MRKHFALIVKCVDCGIIWLAQRFKGLGSYPMVCPRCYAKRAFIPKSNFGEK